jgi:hypothetical protein
MNHQPALGQNLYNANEAYGLGYNQQEAWITHAPYRYQAPLAPSKPDIDYLAITRDIAGR